MSTSKEVRCATFGHEFGSWGLFSHVRAPFNPTFVEQPISADKTEITAFRYRKCCDCGAAQRQAWGSGKIEDMKP